MKSKKLDAFINQRVHEMPEHGWGTILSIFAVYLGMLVLILFVFYDFEVFAPVRLATGGLMNDTFLGTLVLAAVAILALLMRVKKMRLNDLGITKRAVAGGLAGLAFIYAALTGILAVVSLAVDGTVALASMWSDYPASAIIGNFLAQVVMVAPVEEIVFRGYLLPQITLKMKRIRNINPKAALFLGILVTNALFSLMHVPVRLWSDTGPATLATDLFRLLGMGVYFTFVYLVTGNLVMAMAVHALGNFPMLFLAAPVEPFYILFLIVIAMLLSWNKIAKLLGSRELDGAIGER